MLFDGDITFINEEFRADLISPDQLDTLLAQGWRHFGTQFFRYSLGIYEFDIRRVIPLRIPLAGFSLSKSQRRVKKQNSDLQTTIQPIEITAEAIALFERHKQRFKFGVPDSIYDFLSDRPARVPCEAFELTVHFDGNLVATSYFDVGERSVSAIYGMFEPTLSRRGLGIFTMLKEIEFAIETGKEFYYQGYAYDGTSFYDYKKRFRGSEAYNWKGNWRAFGAGEELTADNADKRLI